MHTKKRVKGLDPDGEFDSERMPGVSLLIWWHWSRMYPEWGTGEAL